MKDRGEFGLVKRQHTHAYVFVALTQDTTLLVVSYFELLKKEKKRRKKLTISAILSKKGPFQNSNPFSLSMLFLSNVRKNVQIRTKTYKSGRDEWPV
jgi:hypothetical protein